jgi:chromosome segregation ATPase
MAISETTKIVVAEKKANIVAQIERLQIDKDACQSQLVSLNAQLVALRAQKQSLTDDIPEPTPVEREP